jgi:hypothetical protein
LLSFRCPGVKVFLFIVGKVGLLYTAIFATFEVKFWYNIYMLSTVTERTIKRTRYGRLIIEKYGDIILIFVISLFLCTSILTHIEHAEKPEGRAIPEKIASIVPYMSNTANITITVTPTSN